MARTVVGYLPSGFLNSSASASVSGSTDAETGIAIQTGLTLGAFGEYTDVEAALYTNPINSTFLNKLYSGTYMWVQLDPAVTGTTKIAVGTPLYWLQTATGYVVTNVATANTNDPDFAGVSIDPNFGAQLPFAFIQVNGKSSCLFDSSVAPTYGAVVNTTSGAATFAALASGTLTYTRATVGYALSAGLVSTVQLVRITRPVVRF